MALFTVIKVGGSAPAVAKGKAFLLEDRWDDWGKFRTQFRLVVFDDEGNKVEPGDVKIATVGLQPGGAMSAGVRAPELPEAFDVLKPKFYSLGQGENYYETLNTLPPEYRRRILNGLRDCALDLKLFAERENEPAMQDSLLRDVSAITVRSRLHRLAQGDATLTTFRFAFQLPKPTPEANAPVLTFDVEPRSHPPTNVHVLIGRNGVGKSRCMQSMVRTLSSDSSSDEIDGTFTKTPRGPQRPFGSKDDDWDFAGLVFVSFSAFDTLDLPNQEFAKIRTTLVGLQREADESGRRAASAKSREELRQDFIESFTQCRRGGRAERLRAALKTLGTDPLFADADIARHLDDDAQRWRAEAAKSFTNLSSGHAIVLLTITRLVQLVDERTLVLIDEPEGHLHPPLLSAFVRSLAALLIHRNGVAIIATHSPVVLQEVPRSCVWKMRRSGIACVADRPELETFGENVGVLTPEVFGLEVTTSGFHKLLRDAIGVEGLTYADVTQRFHDQLGSEARAIAMALAADRDSDGSRNS